MTTQRPTRPREGREGRGRYIPKRKVCSFCVDKAKTIDYKDAMKLRSYVSDRGKIEPRRKTGTCARHQRVLALAIKRARHLALLPFVPEHIRKTGGGGPVVTRAAVAPKPAVAAKETATPADTNAAVTDAQ